LLYLRRMLGRRGASLLLIGSIWLIVAWSIYEAPIPLGRVPAPHERFPVEFRIALWTICGVCAIVSAWFRKPGDDAWGFYMLLVPPLERMLSWLWVVAASLYPPAGTLWWHPNPPLGVGLQGFGAWAATTLLILIISGWREPLPEQLVGGANASGV
jgi:hypothetical protein